MPVSKPKGFESNDGYRDTLLHREKVNTLCTPTVSATKLNPMTRKASRYNLSAGSSEIIRNYVRSLQQGPEAVKICSGKGIIPVQWKQKHC
jgi:hypothetical protein